MLDIWNNGGMIAQNIAGTFAAIFAYVTNLNYSTWILTNYPKISK